MALCSWFLNPSDMDSYKNAFVFWKNCPKHRFSLDCEGRSLYQLITESWLWWFSIVFENRTLQTWRLVLIKYKISGNLPKFTWRLRKRKSSLITFVKKFNDLQIGEYLMSFVATLKVVSKGCAMVSNSFFWIFTFLDKFRVYRN